MSSEQGSNFANAGKKAVHVKWAGKTIALGTFPANEADDKCARAKALTRSWRSTMRPKPTREWVMHKLEELGVRVVSGRLGRKAGEDGDEDDASSKKPVSAIDGPAAPAPGQGNAMGGIVGDPVADRNNSTGWGNGGGGDELNRIMARRNSSLGFSMLDGRRGSLGSLGGLMGLDSGDPSMGIGMGLTGGGYGIGPDLSQKGSEQQRRRSSLGLSSLPGGGIGNMGLAVNNQHFEMLKLHHMNLLNEIQETTLMMNLYQQQQIQNQLQNADALTNGDSQMNLMMQQKNQANNMNNFDHMMSGNKQQQQRASLGLGGDDQLSFAQQMMMQQQQQQNLISSGNPASIPPAPENSNAPGPTSKTATAQSKSESPKPEDGKPEKKKVPKKAAQVAKHKIKPENAAVPGGSSKAKDKV